MTNSPRRIPKCWWSAPKRPEAFAEYWRNDLPFTGLPDPTHTVLKKYGQEVNLFKFGMPARPVDRGQDRPGALRPLRTRPGNDIPANAEILGLLQEMNHNKEA